MKKKLIHSGNKEYFHFLIPENHLENHQHLLSGNKTIPEEDGREIKNHGMEYMITSFKDNLCYFNDNNEVLDVIIFDDKYWLPYIEFRCMEEFKNHHLNKNRDVLDLKISYVEGTMHHLGIVVHKGLISEINRQGYKFIVEATCITKVNIFDNQ